jgi:signal-transduction protein with cAMP-binding, CBS, and nucleotidyltransferase domain
LAQKHDIELLRSTLKDRIMCFLDIPKYQLDKSTSFFSIKSFNKKAILIPPDSKIHQFYFINNGFVLILNIAEEKEIISDFIEPNSFFINGYMLFIGLPNLNYNTVLKTTQCLVADYNVIENLSVKNLPIKHLSRKITESYYTSYLITNYNKLFLLADERFDIFTNNIAA